MSKDNQDPAKEWANLMNAIADSVANAPTEDIVAELREAGEDTKQTALEVRTTLLSAVADVYLERRLELQQANREQNEPSLTERIASIPKTAVERFRLLSKALIAFPNALTFQGRELSELTDADVTSTIEKLHRLGLLDQLDSLEQGD